MSWGSFRSYEEANAPKEGRVYNTPPEDGGYVLRIDDLTDPELSPFENRDKNGKLLPRNHQTNVTFTIVDYPNDDPDASVIGQAIRQYYTISLYTGAGFYKLAKAAFGGDLDPKWVPVADDLKGKIVTASLVHKDRKSPDDPIYAKIDSVTAYRGRKKDFSAVPTNRRWLSKDEWEVEQANQEAEKVYPASDGSDVPF